MTLHMTPSPPTDYDPNALHPDLAQFLGADDLSHPAIDGFLAAHAVPLVEPGAATFLWRGSADGVEMLRWIHAGVDRQGFQRIGDSELWMLRLAVADGGRFEYKLAVHHGDHQDWILDPENPDRARDPFGENSVCLTYAYRRPDWSQPQGAPTGHFETLEIDSAAFGQRRSEQVYLPAGYDREQPHALAVIHDGADFMTYADLSASLDNLIAAGDIEPVVTVLIQTHDRLGEYAKCRRHARYVVKELLPAIAQRYAISKNSADRVLLGASLGAVASLVTAFRYPGVFGGLVLNSGSFVLDPAILERRTHPVFGRVAQVVRALRRAPKLPPTRAFVSTGELEGLAGQNRAMVDVLRDRGIDVQFQSAWDGHHWHAWRDQLRSGLMWVLGPQRE